MTSGRASSGTVRRVSGGGTPAAEPPVAVPAVVTPGRPSWWLLLVSLAAALERFAAPLA